MPKITQTLRYIIYLIILFLLLHFLIAAKVKLGKIIEKKTAQTTQIEIGHIGENIIYDVKIGQLTLGKAKFTHLENIMMNDRLVKVIKFETKLARFLDTEIIYSDAETMLPIKVKRSISNWFKQEEITEDYNQTDFTVTINKRCGKKNESFTIKKESSIHNAILLPHYVRNVAKLEQGRILIANLPNQRCEIKLVSIEDIKVPAGVYKAYHFKSIPKQIEIWISADKQRIPIKVLGTNNFGYSLVLREYHSGDRIEDKI